MSVQDDYNNLLKDIGKIAKKEITEKIIKNIFYRGVYAVTSKLFEIDNNDKPPAIKQSYTAHLEAWEILRNGKQNTSYKYD